MAGQGQPPIKPENTKPSFNFSFDSPDLRARQQSRGIYDDSSDDETPKKLRTRMAKVNATSFRAGFSGSAFSNLNSQARSGLGSAVVKTEASGTTTFFGAATTVVPPSAFGSVLTSASMPPSTGASSFFGSTATTATTQAASVSPFQATAPQVPQSQAPSWPSWPFCASATPQAAPSLAFQRPASPATAPPSGPVFQNPPVQPSAATKTLSLFTDATSRTAQAAISSAFQSPTTQTSQAHTPFGPASLSSSTPTPAPTTPKATMAQTEDSRLFAAHMKLLDTGSVSQDLHEVSGTPLFTKKVLDHSEKFFSQYGFLAGMSDVLDSNAAMNINATGPSRPADPRLFFNISAPSSAFICGSQGSGKSHTLSCLLENCLMKSDVSKLDNPLAGLVFHYDSFTSDVKGTPCEAAHISTNPNVKVRVLVSPTNLQTMKVSLRPETPLVNQLTDPHSARTQI
jgi:energy-coupling factor transporter ATP-binding protein EcfA2